VINLRYDFRDDKRTLRRIATLQRRLPGAVRWAVKRQAHRLVAVTKTGIRKGAPGGVPLVPNRPSTIRLKRSSKPLINHGDLLRSIGVTELLALGGDAQFFVGVNRSARTPDGKTSQATIAEWMEYGTRPHLIPITLRMRGFFRHLTGAELPQGQQYLLHPGTPPRPFLAPSIEQWARDVNRLLQEDLVRRLGREELVPL
jgi:hypothetical protein